MSLRRHSVSVDIRHQRLQHHIKLPMKKLFYLVLSLTITSSLFTPQFALADDGIPIGGYCFASPNDCVIGSECQGQVCVAQGSTSGAGSSNTGNAACAAYGPGTGCTTSKGPGHCDASNICQLDATSKTTGDDSCVGKTVGIACTTYTGVAGTCNGSEICEFTGASGVPTNWGTSATSNTPSGVNTGTQSVNWFCEYRAPNGAVVTDPLSQNCGNGYLGYSCSMIYQGTVVQGVCNRSAVTPTGNTNTAANTSGSGSINDTYIKGFAVSIIGIINVYIVPTLIAIAFIVFLYGIYKFFILGATEEGVKGEGRRFAMWGIIGFVIILSVWGIVNIVKDTLIPSAASKNHPAYPTL